MAQVSVVRKPDSPFVYNDRGTKVWSKDGIELVVAQFKDGLSMGLIAKGLDTTIGSIAGVISRAREWNLLPPPSNAKAKAVVERVYKEKKGFDPASLRLARLSKETPQKRVRLKVVESETAVTLVQLKDHSCRFPIGDPKNSDFRFCGLPRENPTYYCTDHCRLVYQPSRFKG